MANQSQLEIVAIQQRATLLPNNYYNSETSNNYSVTHTRAKSDNLTPIQGKGTGIYMDTYNGGGSIDVYGSSTLIGSGRIGNITFNQYNSNSGYQTPNTSGNIGQISF